MKLYQILSECFSHKAFLTFFFLQFDIPKWQPSVVTENNIKHEIDNISESVLLASLSNVQLVLCIAFRLYNMSAQYVCLRNSVLVPLLVERVVGWCDFAG